MMKKISFKGTLWKVTTLENTSEKGIFLCKTPKGIQQLTRFGLGLSHFQEHKVKCKFQDTFDPIYNSNGDTETLCH